MQVNKASLDLARATSRPRAQENEERQGALSTKLCSRGTIPEPRGARALGAGVLPGWAGWGLRREREERRRGGAYTREGPRSRGSRGAEPGGAGGPVEAVAGPSLVRGMQYTFARVVLSLLNVFFEIRKCRKKSPTAVETDAVNLEAPVLPPGLDLLACWSL